MNRGAPLKRKTPLRSKTRIKAKRSTPRRGEPTPDEKDKIRTDAWIRAQARCEIRAEGCKDLFLLSQGDLFRRAHLVHLRGKRRFGWEMDNLCIGCYHCHIELSHQGKIKLPATYGELAEWRKEHAGGKHNG